MLKAFYLKELHSQQPQGNSSYSEQGENLRLPTADACLSSSHRII